MKASALNIKTILLLGLICFLSGIVVLWPSFNVAISGDDYLSIWKANLYASGQAGPEWGLLKYFFTDYGPQDSSAYLIYKLVGFRHRYYFLAAFVLRLVASLSMYLPTIAITKNNKVAFFASIMFMAISTGIEVNNWTFNMPSFIAIAFINLFLYFFLKRNGGIKNKTDKIIR